MQLRMRCKLSCFFFFFVLQGKMQGSCMCKHESKCYAKKPIRCICMAMKWLMQNEMHEMISDNCGNDMSITMPSRDAYAMHDMNAFTDTRVWKIISFYLRIRGHSAPCVQLRRWYGPSGFPWQKTRPIYNACVTTGGRCAKAQQGDVHSMAISSNNHTANGYMTSRLYAWQCFKGTQRVHFMPPFLEPKWEELKGF